MIQISTEFRRDDTKESFQAALYQVNEKMNVFDIIVGIPLLYAAYQGFRQGTAVQLAGLAGLFVGVYLAFRYGQDFGSWLHIDPPLDTVVGFILLIIVVLCLLSLLGHLVKQIFHIAGLGPIDAIGGVLLSVLKMGLILSILVYAFETINQTTHWTDNNSYKNGILYEPIHGCIDLLFPYLDQLKHSLTDINPSIL